MFTFPADSSVPCVGRRTQEVIIYERIVNCELFLLKKTENVFREIENFNPSKHPMFNPDTRKFENLMNSSIASQTAAIAAIAAANSLNASLNVAQSHNQSSE